jgi:hypothetical protein
LSLTKPKSNAGYALVERGYREKEVKKVEVEFGEAMRGEKEVRKRIKVLIVSL